MAKVVVSLAVSTAACSGDDTAAIADATSAASTSTSATVSAPTTGSSGATGTPADSTGTTAANTSSTAAGADDTAGSSSTGAATPSLPPEPMPQPPRFPSVVGTVSIAVRTAPDENAGTLNNDISVCLTETDCFVLDIEDVEDFRRGQIDVYHFDDVGLPRASIDRLEVRSANGPDAWRLGCIELRLDGEPVDCQDEIDQWLGTDPGDTSVWNDADPLVAACTTCYPSPLTHGPLRGAVDEDSARFWVRTDATRAVGLRVGAGPDLDDAPVVAWAYPSPDEDFTAVLEVDDLPSDVDWYYDVEVDGVRQQLEAPPISTAPPPGGTVATFGFGSCSRDEIQPVFFALANAGLDAFFFLGDNHYANSDNLQTLRWHYRRFRGHAPRAAFVADIPIFATWDDHDFIGNNTDGNDGLRDNALRAFREYWANGSYGDGDTEGVFSRHSFGDVDFFMLDNRYHRSIEPDSMLGTAQRTWLIEQLTASTATFKFVIDGSVWTELGSTTDSWAAFLDERDAIFAAIAEQNISGVVLVSGDLHRSLVRWVDNPAGMPLLELTSSPLATVSSPCDSQPEFEFCYEANSFITARVDTTLVDPTIEVTIHDEVGTPVFELATSLAELQP